MAPPSSPVAWAGWGVGCRPVRSVSMSCCSWSERCGSCILWSGETLMSQFLDTIGYSQWILHVLVLLPLAGVVPVLLGDERTAKRMALAVTLIELVLSLGLWWVFDPSDGGMQLVSNAAWIPRWGISYRVGIDGI